jgi:uncharacterized membrane protein
MGRGRIELLDLWRTAAILCMIVYHFLYDLAAFGRMSWQSFFSPGLNAFQLFICGSFILLAGMSSRFSRNNVRRGVVTLLCGFLVMAGAYFAGEPILFGILQFLGVAMLLYGALGKAFERIPFYIAPVACVALFFLTKVWTDSMIVQTHWLWPFGFLYPGFSSADYFPLMPWLFLFLGGAGLGGRLTGGGGPGWLGAKVPPALTWPGRHSLLLYMVHQPILYGFCYFVFR